MNCLRDTREIRKAGLGDGFNMKIKEVCYQGGLVCGSELDSDLIYLDIDTTRRSDLGVGRNWVLGE